MSPFKPVLVQEGGRLLRVSDIQTASNIHLNWSSRGSKWILAANVLSEALHGRETPEKARKAFVSAAREEGVYVERE